MLILQYKDGYTPLHIALLFGYLSIVEYLVSHGANVNITNEDVDTPLHIACKKGYISLYIIYYSSDVIQCCNMKKSHHFLRVNF